MIGWVGGLGEVVIANTNLTNKFSIVFYMPIS